MSCNCHEMNRRELFENINQISFAVDDVKLFLDTHPGNQKALEYFQKYKEHHGSIQALLQASLCLRCFCLADNIFRLCVPEFVPIPAVHAVRL